MYEQIFSIAAICLIAAAGACWSAVRKRSLKRQRLHEKYGKIPETGDWDKEEQVKNYYEWMKKKESGDNQCLRYVGRRGDFILAAEEKQCGARRGAGAGTADPHFFRQ